MGEADHKPYIKNNEHDITEWFDDLIIETSLLNPNLLSFVAISSWGGRSYYNVEVIPNEEAIKRKEFYYWDLENFFSYLADIKQVFYHINREAAEKIWDFLNEFKKNHPKSPGEPTEVGFETIIDSPDKINYQNIEVEFGTIINSPDEIISQNIRDTQNTRVSESNMNQSSSSSSENRSSIDSSYFLVTRDKYWIVRFQLFEAAETDMSSFVNNNYSQNQPTIPTKDNLFEVIENFLPNDEMIDLRKIKVSSLLEIKMMSSEGQSTEDSYNESENIYFWKREKIGDLLDKLLQFGAIRAVSNGLTFKIESFEEFKRITSSYGNN